MEEDIFNKLAEFFGHKTGKWLYVTSIQLNSSGFMLTTNQGTYHTADNGTIVTCTWYPNAWFEPPISVEIAKEFHDQAIDWLLSN